jgi:PAS domain S-box-containing protein
MPAANLSFANLAASLPRYLRATAILIGILVILEAALLTVCQHKVEYVDANISQSAAIVDNISSSESQLVALNAGSAIYSQAQASTSLGKVSTSMDEIRKRLASDPPTKAAFSLADGAESGWVDAMTAAAGQDGLSMPKVASVFQQGDALRTGLAAFQNSEEGIRKADETFIKVLIGIFAFLVFSTLVVLYILCTATLKQLAEIHEEENRSAVDQIDFLKRRNGVLATTLESLKEAVVAVDKGNSIIYINPAAEKLTGWQHEDAISRKVDTVVTLKNDTTKAIIPGPIPAVLDDCMVHELAISSVIESRTGVTLPVDGSATPIWRGQEITGAVMILRDATEYRAAKQAQKASKSLKEAIIESALDCVVLIDAEGKIVEFNPVAAKTFGARREGMLGKTFFETALAPDDHNKITFAFEKAVKSGSGDLLGKRIEVTAVKSDGAAFPAELAIAEIPGQVPSVYAAYLRDISERVAAAQAEALARQAAEADSREKSVFLADMSDELRTPLNAVIGYTEMLQEEVFDDLATKYLPDLEKIHSAGRQLQSMISEILDLSKIESGGMQLYVESFSVADVVRDVEQSTSASLKKNGNSLTINLSDSVGEMQSDRMKMRQGLLNLLSNASRFTSNRKLLLEVTRQSREGSDWVTFRVSDVTGGIPAKEIEQLAEAFAKGGAPSRARFGGRGLGLVIVQHFCEMMGGNIISKRDVGHAATFGMELPAVVNPT